MTRPHIGHFLYHYPKPSGTTTAVRGLARGLARLGHDVTVYCCGDTSPSCGCEVHENNFRVLQFDAGSHFFGGPRRLIERLRTNQDRLDLLIVHGIFNPHNVPVASAAKRAGIPYVVSPHGLYHPELLRKHRIRKLLYGLLYERPTLNDAVAVQVFDEYHIEFLAGFGVRVPAFVVPNGFDPAEAPSVDLKATEPDHRSSSPDFLYLGRIDMYTKGLDLLLRALALGLHEGRLPPSTRLRLAGPDWGDQGTLIRLAGRLGIDRHVRFLGLVEPGSRWSVISSGDFLVLPSRHDAFPTVVFEAMVAAKPVIVSRNTGISSSVRQAGCGFLVEPNAESICAGMVRAAESRDQWRNMGENGRRFAYQNLTWDTVAQRASQSYQKLLSTSAGDRHVA